jgi:hypothetical protein
MRGLYRVVQGAVTAPLLLCIMLDDTSCRRPHAPQTLRPSPQRTASGDPKELKQARQEVDGQARALDAKDLKSAYAPEGAGGACRIGG